MTRQELLNIKAKCEKNLKMATDNNNKARIKNYKDQLNRINEKLNNIGIEALEMFLENYRVKAIEYYNNCLTSYRNDIKEVKPTFTTKVIGNKTITAYAQWNDYINKKYGATTIDIITNRVDNLNTIIEKDIKSKRSSFVNRIEKVVGNIEDYSNLSIAQNGEINGRVIGDKATALVETITAGGYNIQKLHYRVLVKKIK